MIDRRDDTQIPLNRTEEQQQLAPTPELMKDEGDGVILGSNGEVFHFPTQQSDGPSRPPSRVLDIGNEATNDTEERLNRLTVALEADQHRPLRGGGTTAKERHDNLHWSACYDNYCFTHSTAKDTASWHPSIPWWKGRCDEQEWDRCRKGHYYQHLG
jgi:hypothetical protein